MSTPNLATWWRQKSEGVYYWRCQLPARYLPGKVLPLEPCDLALDAQGEPVFPRLEGTAIWQFSGNATRGLMMAHQQEQGHRVMLELDDLYLVLPPQAAMHGSEWQAGYASGGTDHHSAAAHAKIASWVDGIIVSTEALAREYRRVNDRVFVCPNSIDPGDWPEPQPYDGTLRIGWAASSSHMADTHLVRRALRWASKQADVQVVLMGIKPDWDFRFTHVPWTNTLADYRRNLGFLDVGLCAVAPGRWADCKSWVKYLEYSAAGALSVVSKTEPYRPCWEGQLPCLVAETPKQFEGAVRWCVRNRDEVKRIAEEARSYVLAEATMDKHIWKWQEAIAAVAPERLAA